MIGRLRAAEADLADLFSGQGHAPYALSEEEVESGAPATDKADRLNLPEWILPEFERSLGAGSDAIAMLLQGRAPITVRVNLGLSTVQAARDALAVEGITAEPNPVCATALTLTDGERKLRNSQTYIQGLVELQDAASQAVVSGLPKGPFRVLDFCAGGGGKALALAALGHSVTAHDAIPARMRDLGFRAERAATRILTVETDDLPDLDPFDVVLCDAPCSGSGAWRRSPAGKWALSQDDLTRLTQTQDTILDTAQNYVAKDGSLIFATCSVLACENEDRVTAFTQRNSGWSASQQTRIGISDASDGFFHASFSRLN